MATSFPSLQTGLAGTPQKTINPVPKPPQQPQGMDYSTFAKTYNPLNYTNTGQKALAAVGKFAGYSGNALSQDYLSTLSNGYNQPPQHDGGGGFDASAVAPSYDPAFLQALSGYSFSPSNGRHMGYDVTAPDGRTTQINYGSTGTSFDKFAEKAIPIGVAALTGAALGGFIPGAEIGAVGGSAPAGSLLGMDAAALEAGLPGLAGETAGVAGASGAAAPGAAGMFAGEGAAQLAASQAAMQPLTAAQVTASTLPAGGLPGLSAATTAAPGVFNAAADSQAYNASAGITGAEGAATATAPSTVNLTNAGGTMGTAGGVSGQIAAALADPVKAAGNLGFSALSAIKANPQLAAMGASGLAGLIGGSPDLPDQPGAGGNSALATALETQIAGGPDYSGVFGLKNTAGDLNTLNQEAIDAAYSQQTRMLDPQFQRDKQAMEARLSEQGFVPGTPGYERAMTLFGEQQNKAYGAARDSSILQGYQIGQGDARNALSDAELNNSASREALAQILAKRNQPFNEMASVKANQQIDYNNSLDRYNAEVASSNSKNQSLSQLALALGMYLG